MDATPSTTTPIVVHTKSVPYCPRALKSIERARRADMTTKRAAATIPVRVI